MNHKKIEYGPIARGIYIALATLVPVSFFGGGPQLAIVHMALLIFLGFALRPLLEKSGIYSLYQGFTWSISEKYHRKRTEQRRREVERQERDKKYRSSRIKDPRLPKNW